MAAIKDENLQRGAKEPVENDGGGHHGGTVLLSAVCGVAVDQLPAKEQKSVNQFTSEVVDLSSPRIGALQTVRYVDVLFW